MDDHTSYALLICSIISLGVGLVGGLFIGYYRGSQHADALLFEERGNEILAFIGTTLFFYFRARDEASTGMFIRTWFHEHNIAKIEEIMIDERKEKMIKKGRI